MAGTGKYTAEDLARLGGVPLRTVRYYLQERLIDPPSGRGPGAHFGERHLNQLRRARAFQNVGLDNAAIRRHADDLERILAERGLNIDAVTRIWAAFALNTLNNLALDRPDEPEAPDEDDEEELDPATAIRVPMAPGIELLVASDIELPSPRRLVEIALYIRRVFGRR
jgi:DNA-binding transcriptional MerR regulator